MNATRLNDLTTGICNVHLPCCPHGRTGINETCSPNVFINGLPVHRLTDGGAIMCPHGGYFQSVAASKSVFVNGLGITRINDATVCTACGQGGNHSTGSPNVFAGD